MRFVWSGDTVGQGWGINPDLGGMRIYETMRQVEPDFFIHSGDTIYADGPIYAEARTQDGKTWLGPDGKPWRNVTIPEKEKVAETLREYRMNYAYNLMDENLRRFNAAVPMYAQWDDHEVTNNWYWELQEGPGQALQGGQRRAPGRTGDAGVPRLYADPAAPAGAGPALHQLRLRPLARGVPDRPALLSRPEQRGHADRAQPRGADHRRSGSCPG